MYYQVGLYLPKRHSSFLPQNLCFLYRIALFFCFFYCSHVVRIEYRQISVPFNLAAVLVLATAFTSKQNFV
ncbi:hypothetical protein BDF21DRAFT_22634 [Thamnidium elegans]|nr:hypothetical protein BDF21DRAFT_22634 [Thamnidium elegans]